MAKGSVVVEVKQAGAPRAARDLSRAARNLRREMVTLMRASGDELAAPFKAAAPFDVEERDSYHMRDHITVKVSGAGLPHAEVDVQAISPENGFDYLAVTRFGHRGTIRVKRAKYLRWVQQGEVMYAKETAGWHPAGDWVEDAMPEAEAVADALADRIGRTVYTRLL